MIKLQGAVIKEQGITFAIIVVKKHIVDSALESEKFISFLAGLFPKMPIVLVGLEPGNQAKFRGRPDLVLFLTHIHMSQIPWKDYTFS